MNHIVQQANSSDTQPKNVAESGFTLIELMIVVAIVGILAAIGYPSYTEHVRKGARAEGKAALVKGQQLMERYYTDKGKYSGASLKDLFGASGTNVYSGENPSSAAGKYEISFDGTVSDNAYKIQAVPNGSFSDSGCGTLTVTNANVRTKSGTLNLDQCW